MTMASLAQSDALLITADQDAHFELQSGRVLRKTEAGTLIVLAQGREWVSRCAASCLLMPEPGDLVLFAADAADTYILAVLQRPGSAPAVLTAAIPSECLVLAAKKLELRAKEDIEVSAPQTVVRGSRLTFAADAVAFVAKLLTQTLGRWQSSAQNIDMVATDIATKAARRVTLVDETDTLQAGAILQKVDAASVTQAEAVVIAVKEDLRLDGARVTVG